MTVELDEIIKNLNGRTLTIEITKEDEDDNDSNSIVYIGTDNTSGVEYQVQSAQEVGEMLAYYLMNYFTD